MMCGDSKCCTTVVFSYQGFQQTQFGSGVTVLGVDGLQINVIIFIIVVLHGR